MTKLRIGGATISMDDAKAFTSKYVTNQSGRWAYPAYDAYPGHDGPEVGRADLLAVALLNAGQRAVETYYGLESKIDTMNELLNVSDLNGSLANATEDTVDAIADLYGLLDYSKPRQVGLTKLSKVLHRKRPELLPLYDKHIRRCYVDIGEAPVPRDRNRSWTDFTRVWATAVRNDLASQYDEWTELASLAPGPKISPLRALDIVGWHRGSSNYGK